MTVEVEVNVHAGSVHEARMDVNLGNKKPASEILAQVDEPLAEG